MKEQVTRKKIYLRELFFMDNVKIVVLFNLLKMKIDIDI